MLLHQVLEEIKSKVNNTTYKASDLIENVSVNSYGEWIAPEVLIQTELGDYNVQILYIYYMSNFSKELINTLLTLPSTASTSVFNGEFSRFFQCYLFFKFW